MPYKGKLPPFIDAAHFGRAGLTGSDARWQTIGATLLDETQRIDTPLAFLACIKPTPEEDNEVAVMLGFNLRKVPREVERWGVTSFPIERFSRWVAKRSSDNSVSFAPS
jgi:hypothetical protein